MKIAYVQTHITLYCIIQFQKCYFKRIIKIHLRFIIFCVVDNVVLKNIFQIPFRLHISSVYHRSNMGGSEKTEGPHICKALFYSLRQCMYEWVGKCFSPSSSLSSSFLEGGSNLLLAYISEQNGDRTISL